MKNLFTPVFLFIFFINTYSQYYEYSFRKYETNKGRYKTENEVLKNKDKITYLSITHYSDTIFPNDVILKLPNLKELYIHGKTFRPITYKGLTRIKIDTVKIKTLKIEELGIQGFNLNSVPVGLSKIKSLKKLVVNYNNLDSITDNIANFAHLEELNLMGNCLVYISPKIKHLKNIKTLDLAHNRFKNIPESIVHMDNLKRIHLGNNYGRKSFGFNFNDLDFSKLHEIEKLYMLLIRCERVGVGFEKCINKEYIINKIDRELWKKKLGFSIYEDCK